MPGGAAPGQLLQDSPDVVQAKVSCKSRARWGGPAAPKRRGMQGD